MRKWTLGRVGSVLAAFTMAFAVVTSGATPASAAADKTCTNLQAEGVSWGGTYFCNYGYESDWLENGVLQVWVVAGAGHNVFTRWLNQDGSMPAWYNLGGNVLEDGNTGYLAQKSVPASGGHVNEVVRVIGTNNAYYCNVRSGAAGSWNGWTQGHCSVW